MGRKRLLALSVAVTTTVALQAAPAAAQTIPLPGLGGVTVGGDGDCLELGVDISLGSAGKLDPGVCLMGEDGERLRVDGGVVLGESGVPLGEATKPVQDAVNRGSSSTPTPDPSPSPSPSPSAPPSSGGGSDAPGGGSGDTGGGSDDAGADADAAADEAPDVQASGSATEVTPERERQLAALAALRSDLSARGDRGIGGLGAVAPGVGGGDSLFGDAAAPEVADAGRLGDDRVTPSFGSGRPDRTEAVLATSLPEPASSEAPLTLQLLAGAMVLGAGTVWYLASREVRAVAPTSGS